LAYAVLNDLLIEFEAILRDALDSDNPLHDALEEERGEKYIASQETVNAQARLKP
jgi:hypothetical protein